jgi:hypothetical protein
LFHENSTFNCRGFLRRCQSLALILRLVSKLLKIYYICNVMNKKIKYSKCILFLLLLTGFLKYANAQVACPPDSCPPCMTVSIENKTTCDMDWAFFYNPDCSVNPSIHVPAGQIAGIAGPCMRCGDSYCKCPAGINLVIPPPIGGFIGPWGEFSTMTIGNPSVYNNINYPCNCPPGKSLTITAVLVNPNLVRFTVECL